MLTVITKKQITPNMLRITLQGMLLKNFCWKPGCYIKIKVPFEEKYKMRTYTVRSYDSTKESIDVDFSLHQPAGPATSWALNVKVGGQIEYKGPGYLKADFDTGNWYLFAADMSALPAVISILETLDKNSKGYAFLEIINEQDKQELFIPKGIVVQWLIHSNPKNKSEQQLKSIKSIKLPERTGNIFVAGELTTIREIKNYIEGNNDFKVAQSYISSYWKIGMKEEEHKLEKRFSKA